MRGEFVEFSQHGKVTKGGGSTCAEVYSKPPSCASISIFRFIARDQNAKADRADKRQPERAQRITTAPGARTGFFLENSGRLYVAVPHRGSQGAKVLVTLLREAKKRNDLRRCTVTFLSFLGLPGGRIIPQRSSGVDRRENP